MKLSAPIQFQIEVDDVVYRGEYSISKEVIKVVSDLGNETTYIGGMPCDHLAKMLLHEMVLKKQANNKVI